MSFGPTRGFWFCLALSLVASSALAADEERPFQLLVAAEPGVSYSEIDGFDLQSSFSLGLGYRISPRWATELRAGLQGWSRSSSGEESSAYTIDAVGHFSFFRRSRWGVFAAGGLRLLDSDFGPSEDRGRATGLLVGLGADYRMSPRFSLRLDATAVPLEVQGENRRLDEVSLSVGFGFRF